MEKIEGRERIVKEIENILQSKYNENFKVLRVGNRYGQDKLDIVEAICCPENNESVVFKIKADINGKMEFEEDDYYIKSITNKIDFQITEYFKRLGIESFSRSETIKKNRIDRKMKLIDFIHKYSNVNFLSIVVIDGKVEKDRILKVFKSINNYNMDIKLNAIIYQISNEKYSEFKKEHITIPSISRTMIENDGFLNRCSICIENNNIRETGE